VVLVAEIKALEEVIVIGYGTVKKKDLTGSVTAVSSNELVEATLIRADDALQGLASGVTVTKVGGAPGDSYKIIIL